MSLQFWVMVQLRLSWAWPGTEHPESHQTRLSSGSGDWGPEPEPTESLGAGIVYAFVLLGETAECKISQH